MWVGGGLFWVGGAGWTFLWFGGVGKGESYFLDLWGWIDNFYGWVNILGK